jgi:AmmeMemoRadiSam system protein B
MDSTYSYPKLRWPIELRMERIEDEDVLLVRCPVGLTPQPLLLVSAVAPIVTIFDGALSFQQILDRFSPQGLSSETLTQLIKLLDDNLFIANGNFHAASKAMREEYHSLPERVPALAGLSYPDTADRLASLVDAYMNADTPNDGSPVLVEDGPMVCLVAPHIDYRRGGATYGKIYPRLAQSKADLYVLIGTAHQYSSNLFHLSLKDFRSPLGVARCNGPFVSQLAKRFGADRAFADEYLHKQEHSLELQLPFFSRIKPDGVIAPILVGGFHEMVAAQRSPAEWDEYNTFASALAEGLTEWNRGGRTFCFVAGVDMAHIGASFGDPGNLTPESMREIATRDSAYLAAIESGDKDRLFLHIAEDGDARRMCGFPTMYTVLDVLERIGQKYTADAVYYDQAVDYTRDCAVTFAGVSMVAALTK